MRDNNFGQQLVANEKFQQEAFRSAESAVHSVLTDANVTVVINSAGQELLIDYADDGVTKATAGLQYVGTSLSVGSSLAKFSTYNFTARGRADIGSVDAVGKIVQGASRLAPSP